MQVDVSGELQEVRGIARDDYLVVLESLPPGVRTRDATDSASFPSTPSDNQPGYLASSLSRSGFSAGTSTVAVSQTVETSMPKYSCAAMLRIPFILRHGICGSIA